MEPQKVKKLSRVRKKVKLLLLGAVLICLITGVIVVARSLNAPSEGVVHAPAQTPTATSEAKVSLLTERGKTATFQYPSTFQQRKADVLTSLDVEKFALVRERIPLWDLAIQVRKLPSGALADDGSYNYRKHYPDKYLETKVIANGQSVPVMADQSGGFAKVAFLTHQGLVAEISLSCNSSSDSTQLDEALLTVLRTWQWL